jgi:hypothetical protein
MENKNYKFKELLTSIFKSAVEQKLIFILSCLTCFAFILGLWAVEFNSESLLMNFVHPFLVLLIFSFPLTLYIQKNNLSKKCLVELISLIFLYAFTFIVIYFSKIESYRNMRLFGIYCILSILLICTFIPSKNNESYFANLVKYFCFTFFISLIACLGIIGLFAITSLLIHEINDMDKVSLTIFYLGYLILFPNMFAYFLFEKRNVLSGKAFKIIFLYVLFSVFCFLILILYVYLFKSLFTKTMPVGEINWYVSFAMMCFTFFYFILREYKNTKIISFFYKWGAFFLIPLLILQIVCVSIRINAYGLTGFRYSSLLYIIFSLATISLAIIDSVKNTFFVKYSLVCLAFLIFVDTLTPFNLIDMAYRSQYKKIMGVLKKYELYSEQENKIFTQKFSDVFNTMDKSDQNLIKGSYRYLTIVSDHKKPDIDGFENLFPDENKILGEELTSVEYRIFKNEAASVEFDIAGFSKISKGYYSLYEDTDRIILKISDDMQIDLTDFVISHADNTEPYLTYKVNDKMTVVFVDLDATYNLKTKKYNCIYMSYYLLKK